MEWYRGSGAPIVINFNYWYRRQEDRNYFWPITLRCLDILDVCEPTPDGYRYILVIADYFSKWTEAFPIKDKCADTVADVLVNKILRFGMPLVIQ